MGRHAQGDERGLPKPSRPRPRPASTSLIQGQRAPASRPPARSPGPQVRPRETRLRAPRHERRPPFRISPRPPFFVNTGAVVAQSLWRTVPYSPHALLLHQFRTALHLPLLSCRYSEVLPCHLSQGPRRRAPHLLEGQQVGREEEHPPSSADGGTRQEEAPADITLSATLPRPETAQVPHSLQTSPAAETARGLPIDAEAFGPRDLWEATASSAPSRRLPRSPHQVHMAGHASRERALPHPRASARRRPVHHLESTPAPGPIIAATPRSAAREGRCRTERRGTST